MEGELPGGKLSRVGMRKLGVLEESAMKISDKIETELIK